MAEKHGWPEHIVWSQALKGKDDLSRFSSLYWDRRPWDVWDFEADKRFGDESPEQIPAQVIAHILYFFSNQNDLVFDPMAGSGVCADTCLAFINRDYRDYYDYPAYKEDPKKAIFFIDYCKILKQTGCNVKYIIRVPLSSEPFEGERGEYMQEKGIIATTGRHVMMSV